MTDFCKRAKFIHRANGQSYHYCNKLTTERAPFDRYCTVRVHRDPQKNSGATKAPMLRIVPE